MVNPAISGCGVWASARTSAKGANATSAGARASARTNAKGASARSAGARASASTGAKGAKECGGTGIRVHRSNAAASPALRPQMRAASRLGSLPLPRCASLPLPRYAVRDGRGASKASSRRVLLAVSDGRRCGGSRSIGGADAKEDTGRCGRRRRARRRLRDLVTCTQAVRLCGLPAGPRPMPWSARHKPLAARLRCARYQEAVYCSKDCLTNVWKAGHNGKCASRASTLTDAQCAWRSARSASAA